MSEIRIGAFHATHHGSSADALARIAAVQQTLLAEELEAAFAPYAPDEEIIVVKRLDSPVPLAARHTDRQSARNWSAALAEELARSLRGGRNMLRFRNRMSAQAAFGEDALSGSAERDWAWQQLGMLPQDRHISARKRLDAFLALAARESETLLPLLRVLSHSSAWTRLMQHLDTPLLEALTRAVLQACGGDHVASFATPEEIAAFSTLKETQAETELACAALPRGPLLETLIQENSALRRLWQARLAALIVEPRLGRQPVLRLERSAQRWLAAGENRSARLQTRDTEQPTAEFETGTHAIDDAMVHTVQLDDDAMARTNDRLIADASTEKRASAPTSASAAAVPVSGYTAYGGLLLLVPLLDASGALPVLEDESIWGADSWPLALHRFATRVLPLAADDPAVLAFCGLAPGSDIPHPSVVLNEAQQSALDAARDCVQRLLCERLPEEWHGPALITRLAQRSATIIADPGWIEIRFALREVSLDIRRAALDLDPGFIPWLGVVLSYSYE